MAVNPEAMGGSAAAAGLIAGATPFGWATLGASLLGGAAGSSTPAGPSSADAVFSNSFAFDNSGWNVAFDSAKVDSTAEKTTSQGGASGAADPSQSAMKYGVIILALLIAWKLAKK